MSTLALLTALISISRAGAAVRYVDQSAIGANNGTSWTDAYTSLQSAMTVAVAGDEVWVATATYKPAAPGGSRSAAFNVKSGVFVYGGFPVGGGTFAQRDSELHPTTLSGDLNGNDGPNFTNDGENSYHVVTAINVQATTLLDGFIITSGNANGSDITERRGGGVFLSDDNATGPFTLSDCEVMSNRCMFHGGGIFIERGQTQIIDCHVHDNTTEDGGGIFVNLAASTITNCIVEHNTVTASGGGVAISAATGTIAITDTVIQYNTAARHSGGLRYSSPNTSNLLLTIDGCQFRGNQTLPSPSFGQGGGMSAEDCAVRLLDCDFIANTTMREGGGAYLKPSVPSYVVNCNFRGNSAGSATFGGGGIYVFASSACRFENCLFDSNSATGAGGGLSAPSSTSAHPVVQCTFWNNSAGTNGGGAYYDGILTFANSIFWSNSDSSGQGQAAQVRRISGTPSISYSCVQGWTGVWGGSGNHGLDPSFIDGDGADNAPGNDDDDLRLPTGSPCVDAGNNAALPPDTLDIDGDANIGEPLPLDLAGIPRAQDDPSTPDTGSGTAPIVDMGAYEFGDPLVIVTYVGPSGGSWFTPTNWSSGEVPLPNTNVILPTLVNIAQGGATAREVLVQSGAQLSISTGDLTATAVIVSSGGTLSLSNAAAVLETGSMNLQSGSTLQWTSGRIRLVGGGWSNVSGIVVGCSGPATLELDQGAVVTAPTVQICALGTLMGRGMVVGAVSNLGAVSPGASAGAISIQGSYQQSSGASLNIELGGYSPGVNHDVLQVSGNATLAGALNVTLLSGFAHDVGLPQTLLTAANVIGSFSSTNIPPLPGNTLFIYQPASTSIGLFTMLTQTGPRVFVSASASGGGEGQSWPDAIRSLQGALEVAAAFPATVNEIWVREGQYKPTKWTSPPSALSATFMIREGVAMYGGFAGTETSIDQRNIAAHPTVLSGDLAGNDGANFANYDDNVTHVVTASAGNPYTVPTAFDGFVVRGGNAQGTSTFGRGGGMIVQTATPTVRNCRFELSAANLDGGGLYLASGSTVEDCTFSNNQSFSDGAGMFVPSNFISPRILGCRFEYNVAKATDADGGGLSCASMQSSIIDCTFVGNVAEGVTSGGGGALIEGDAFLANCAFLGNRTRAQGGGLSMGGSGAPVVVNCVFSGNSAGVGFPTASNQNGGAMFANSQVDLTIANCVMAGNVATNLRGGLSRSSTPGVVSVANSIFWNNQDSGGSGESAQLGGSGVLQVNWCNVQGWSGALGGQSNSGSNPLFVDADGADNLVGTNDDDLTLSSTSPCIDAGSNASVPNDRADQNDNDFTDEPVPVDASGHIRFFDVVAVPDTGEGGAPLVDIGPYEIGSRELEAVVYVGQPGGSWFTASNWSSGDVPDATTVAHLATHVIVDDVATVNSVVVQSGGVLEVANGTINAVAVSVRAGAALHMTDPDAELTAIVLVLRPGSSLTWNAGSISIHQRLESSQNIAFGCIGAAELLIADGASVIVPNLSVCSLGQLRGAGAVIGNVSNGGLVSPGASPGTLTINGSYLQTATAELLIEIGRFAPGVDSDRLIVTGTATLNGALIVETLPQFVPAMGIVEFLSAASIVGTFSSTDLSDPGQGMSLVLEMDSVHGLLIVMPPGPRLYVNAAAPPGGQGISWNSAITSMAVGLQAARISDGDIDEIWVAQGTYLPAELSAPSDPRSATFVLAPGVAIYGGFVGGETQLDQRDFIKNVTILSGDVNDDDGPSFSNRQDNVYRVLSAFSLNSTSIVDGFSIDGGYAADGPSGHPTTGAGLYASVGGPLVRNCRFVSNFAENYGGAVHHVGGLVTFEDCSFEGNAVPTCPNPCFEGHGGAIMNEQGAANLTRCNFMSNSAVRGGSIMNVSAGCVLNECEFVANEARLSGAGLESRNGALTVGDCVFRDCVMLGATQLAGGGMWLFQTAATITDTEFTNNVCRGGAGLFMNDTDDTVSLSGCTFTGNQALETWGGAVENDQGSPTFDQCTFTNNSAAIRGGAVATAHASGSDNQPVFTNCMFSGNSAGSESVDGIGGAIACWQNENNAGATLGPRVVNCTFDDNSATESGGAISNDMASMSLVDCSFEGNSSSNGGAVFNEGSGVIRGRSQWLASDELHSAGSVRPGQFDPNPAVGMLEVNSYFRLLDRGPSYEDHPGLTIDLLGVSALDHDVVDVSSGTVEFTGALSVSFGNGFVPQQGDGFQIVQYATRIGQFGVATFAQLPPGLLMSASYEADGLWLRVESVESDINFADPTVTGLTGPPIDAQVGDLDNDGDPDLVALLAAVPPANNGSVVVMRNNGINGQGVWLGFAAPSAPMSVGVGPTRLTVGWFDSDAYLDIAVANLIGNSVTKFRNSATGNATFNAAETLAIASPTSVAAGRFFATWEDLAVGTANDTVVVRRFGASGSFVSDVVLSSGDGPVDVECQDVDGDLQDDIVALCIASPPTGPTTVAVHHFDITAFDPAVIYPAGHGASDLAMGDVQDDGLYDVLIASPVDQAVYVLVNSGGTFNAPVPLPMGTLPSSIDTFDAEPDGDLDIVSVVEGLSGEPVIRLARNDINGGLTATFSEFSDVVSGQDSVVVRTVDLNADGVKDLLSVNASSSGVASTATGSVAAHLNLDIRPCPADVTGNGTVNVLDLLAVISAWGATGSNPADVNGDNVVNIIDLLAVIAAWGLCS